MIQIYAPNNTDFTKNGNAVLFPTEAYTEAELNGSWAANIVHPIDSDGIWKNIVEEAVIKMPSWNGDQLYRISSINKTITEISAVAYPIFYDAAKDAFIVDKNINAPASDFLDALTEDFSKYTATTNFTGTKNTRYKFMNLMECLTGEAENSFLNLYGGEVEFDNFTIRIKNQLGSDTGVCFRYGRDIVGITETVDMADVVTRIYPMAYNERKMDGTKYVDSPHINDYPTVKSCVMEFSDIILKKDASDEDKKDSTKTICKDKANLRVALIHACEEQFAAGVDTPVVTLSIDEMVDISTLEGFRDLNRQIRLGDTVHLRHPKLDIVSDSRVIYIKYDSIRKCVQNLTVGHPEYNFMSDMASTVSAVTNFTTSSGEIKGEKLTGSIDMAKTSLHAEKTSEDTEDKTCILFENTDTTSEMYGAMALGTQGFMISKTQDENGDWIWSTIGNANGIIADSITSGILQSKDGNSFWDLTNSRFVFFDADFNASVVIDEGYIALAENGVEYGKIHRMLLNGNPVLSITTADNKGFMIDGATGKLFASCNDFLMNGYSGFTGQKTIGNTTLHFMNGILIS